MSTSRNPGGGGGLGILGGLMGLGILIAFIAIIFVVSLVLSGCSTDRVQILDKTGNVVARGGVMRVLTAAKDQKLEVAPDGTITYSVGESDSTKSAGEIVSAAVRAALSSAGS
jgi:hypothetical protein